MACRRNTKPWADLALRDPCSWCWWDALAHVKPHLLSLNRGAEAREMHTRQGARSCKYYQELNNIIRSFWKQTSKIRNTFTAKQWRNHLSQTERTNWGFPPALQLSAPRKASCLAQEEQRWDLHQEQPTVCQGCWPRASCLPSPAAQQLRLWDAVGLTNHLSQGIDQIVS